jgi:DNA-directed RNA polymerase subunit K/omega
MWHPPVELLVRAGNRYAAVAMVAARARQLRAGAFRGVADGSTHPVTVALEELTSGRLILEAPSGDGGQGEAWWPAATNGGGTGPMSVRRVDTQVMPTAVTVARSRTWLWPWVRGMRASLAVWVVLAVAGWGAAGVGVVAAVRAYQGTSQLAALAGLTPVQGPGIEVVVSDGERKLRPKENPSVVLVQEGDLIFLNMMLWYGGTRGVAINGERVTAQSTITSSGPTLLINGRRVVGPFHVLAIGDPDVLRGALEARGGFVDRMQQAGLGIAVMTQENLTVPARTPAAAQMRSP